MLIYVVVLMLIFGVLGVVMVSLFTSSTASTVTRNDTRRAIYMAESGMRYGFSEIRNTDFDIDFMRDTLNTTTYSIGGAESFTINVFSPWFESPSNQTIGSGGGNLALEMPVGELPDGYSIPTSNIFAINWRYTKENPADEDGSWASVTGFNKETTTLTLGDDFNVSRPKLDEGEEICLAVRPKSDQPIVDGGDLDVSLEAQTIFPKYGGAINIRRNDYFYEERIDDPDNNRVILRNLSKRPESNWITATTSDFVVLSPRNYMVAPTGKSGDTIYGGDYTFAKGIYYKSLIPGEGELKLTSMSEQETETRFFELNTAEDKFYIGGGGGSGGGLTNQFGTALFNETLSIGGKQDYCVEGACLFELGVRVYFLLDFIQQGDGITFTLLNGANNRETSAGGDFELSELMGYAGDSRTASPPGPTDFLATAPEDRGLDPPKIAVEFDTRTDNNTLAYCNGTNVNQHTRDDPLVNNQDAVQYVFWGGEANVASPCRDNPTYDDNRHGPGLWEFDNPSGKVKSSPAIDPGNGTIYVGSNDNKLYAINPNGGLKWAFTTGGDVISSPAIASDGTIYVGSNDNQVYAIRPNGTLRWQFGTGGDVRSSPAVGSDGTIYIGSDDGNMYALDPTTGAQKPGWPFNAGAAFSLGHPAIGQDGTIYASDQVSMLYAFNQDGTLKWTFNLTDGNDYMPGIDRTGGPNDGTIYSDIFGSSLVAINPDGSEKWQFLFTSPFTDIDSTPTVGPDGVIYFGTDAAHALIALNPNGTEKWRFATGDEVNDVAALSPDGSLVYAVSDDGNVYAVDTQTGEEMWSFAIVTDTADSPANVTSSPAVDPNTGIIYVGSDDTNLYALTQFDEEPRNLQGLLLNSATSLGGIADSAVDWLNGSSIKGPWAVRLEVDRGVLGDYELRLWMKQCDNDICDKLNGANDPFFKDTRIIYQVSPPDLVQSFQLDATKHAEFDRFLFGFTAAAGDDPLDVIISNFVLSFARPGDPPSP